MRADGSHEIAPEVQAATQKLRRERAAAINLMEDALAARRKAQEAEQGLAQRNAELQKTVEDLQTAQEEIAAQNDEIRRQNDRLLAAQSSLVAERERYSDLFEAAPVGYLVTDDRGTILRANRAAMAMLQRWPNELVGVRLGTFVATGWRTAFLNALDAVRKGMDVGPLEFHIAPVGSNGFDAELTVALTQPTDDPESQRQARWALRDITERKRAEEALANAKAAAEAANDAKGRFLANMSHELRTPMNAILGMIDVALPKADHPTVQDCLKTAKESADLLLTLLNDLLDSAKIESGKLELESAPFSLREMLDQITRVLGVRASEKGLSFACQVPDETPDAFVGDRTRLQQILLNLASNAVKFTQRGGVEMSLHAVSQNGKARLKFAVRDTGIGIPQSSMDRLFQPFGQADASMSRRFGGTGLGLSISKSLVEMMGGHIWVESEEGIGSTFYFTVPLPLAAEPSVEADTPVVPSTKVRGQLRVLLAEDNPANQKLAIYVLTDRGHFVDVAEDGRQAVAFSEQSYYDVILMDVQMPGMDGLEATAVIRKREKDGRRVPIIAMTAHAMKRDRERCLAGGMDGYLSKPIDAQEMISLVERLAADSPSTNSETTKRLLAQEQPAGPSSSAAFDPVVGLARCLNRPSVFAQMVQFALADLDKLLPQIHAALKPGDLAEVGKLGHRLKGTLTHIAAEPARTAAIRVERFEFSGDGQAEAEAAVLLLEQECRALRAALVEHQATSLQST